MSDAASVVADELTQAIESSGVEHPVDVAEGLSALAQCPTPTERDPADEERLANKRRALEAGQAPRHTRRSMQICMLAAALAFSQLYSALIARSAGLLIAGAATLLFAILAWRKSHWLQFNLRTALAGMVLASLPLGWVGAIVRQSWREQEALEALVSQWGCEYTRTYDHLPKWFVAHCPDEWLDSFAHVDQMTVHAIHFGDEQMPLLERFHSLEILNLSYTQVSDAGVEHLRGRNRLHSLFLRGTKVTDRSFHAFEDLPALREVNGINTQMTRTAYLRFKTHHPNLKMALWTAPRPGRASAATVLTNQGEFRWHPDLMQRVADEAVQAEREELFAPLLPESLSDEKGKTDAEGVRELE